MTEHIAELGIGKFRLKYDDATNTYALQWYDSATAAWKDVMTYNTATQRITRLIVTEEVADGAITKAKISTDTIRIEIPIPLLTNSQTGLAADATGVKYETPYQLLVSADMLQSAKAAYIEAHIEASATDSATAVEFYDVTAAAVRGSASANAGARVRSADFKGSLVAGNEHTVRIDVTTASATAGATTGVQMARLILVIGIG